VLSAAGRADGEFLAVAGAARKPGVDAPFGCRRGASDDGEIFFARFAVVELAAKKFMGAGGSGYNDDAGGVFVEAVDNAGAGWGFVQQW
jgi:hypothetical protein